MAPGGFETNQLASQPTLTAPQSPFNAVVARGDSLANALGRCSPTRPALRQARRSNKFTGAER